MQKVLILFQASKYSKRYSSTRYQSLTGDLESDGLFDAFTSNGCLEIIWKTKGPVLNDELDPLYASFLACAYKVGTKT